MVFFAAAMSAQVTVGIRDCLSIRATLDLDTMRMARMESAVLTPVLVNGSMRHELRPVLVNGSWSHRLYLRRMHGATGATAVECGKKGAGRLEYADSCLYEPWMADARLILEQEGCGCGGKETSRTSRLMASGIMTRHATENVAEEKAIAENAMASKEKSEIRMTLYLDYLRYPLSSTELLPDYCGNRKELAKITTALDSLLSVPDTEIEVVELTGYGSPEGLADFNAALAFGRTVSLRDWLQKTPAYRPLPFSTMSVPEDWQGLRRLVEKSAIDGRDALLEIIDSPAFSNDEREERIRRLDGGRVFETLLSDFFPTLRRTVCAIRYKRK